MRSWKKLLVILLLAATVVSCQKAYHQKGETYYLIGNNMENPYWKEVRQGFLAGVRSLGLELNGEVGGPATRNVEQQLVEFRKAVAARPAGILVSPAEPGPFTEPIDQAIEQGIPVITIDSDAPESKRVTFIGTDNYQAGRQGGEIALKILQKVLSDRKVKQVNIIILTVPGQLNLDERVRGYREVLARNRKIRILAVLNNEGSIQKSHDLITTQLERPGAFIDGIVCVEAAGGEGAVSALYKIDAQGKIPIIAMDKNQETLDWIERGGIAATISQKPYTMAYYGVKLLDDLHHNAVRQFKDWKTAPVYPLPSRIDTGTAVVNKENLKEFEESLPPPPGPLG